MRPNLIATALLALAAAPALAAPDPAEGKRLVAEKKCEACHEAKKPAEARSIYQRTGRRANSMAQLKAMVAACNSELNLQLFPDEEEHIAAYLDQDFYRFGKK